MASKGESMECALEGVLMTKRKCGRWLVVLTIVVFGVFSIVAAFVADSTTAAFDFEVRARYRSMPLNDNQLHTWLRDQRGVTNSVVFRENGELRITFVMIQNLLKTDPPVPELKAALEGLSYQGEEHWECTRSLYFRD